MSSDVKGRDSKKKKGIFRGNRGLIILLIDILLILLLYFILNPLLQRRAADVNLQGYQLQLKGFSFEDEVLASLRIVYIGDGADAGEKKSVENEATPPPDRMAEVVFSLEGGEPDAAVSDILPSERGSERVLRGRLPSGGGRAKTLSAEVTIDGETVTLKAEIEPEQD